MLSVATVTFVIWALFFVLSLTLNLHKPKNMNKFDKLKNKVDSKLEIFGIVICFALIVLIVLSVIHDLA